MDNILKVRDVKPVKGTFKLHVVSGIGKSEVFVRETSCYCNVCLEGGICDGWRKEGLGKVAGVNPGNDPGVTEDPSVIEDRGVIENNDVQIRVEKDQNVIATYLQEAFSHFSHLGMVRRQCSKRLLTGSTRHLHALATEICSFCFP
jgi:hypothetical protein